MCHRLRSGNIHVEYQLFYSRKFLFITSGELLKRAGSLKYIIFLGYVLGIPPVYIHIEVKCVILCMNIFKVLLLKFKYEIDHEVNMHLHNVIPRLLKLRVILNLLLT